MSRIDVAIVLVLGFAGAILTGYSIAERAAWALPPGVCLYIAAHAWMLRPRSR